jgi:signal transduction histidine kinase
MSPISLQALILIILALESILYIPIVAFAWRRHKGVDSPAFWLAAYALLAFLLQALDILGRAGMLTGIGISIPAPQDMSGFLPRLAPYGTVILALLSLHILQRFLKIVWHEHFLTAAMVWTAIAIALQNTLILFITWGLWMGLSVYVLILSMNKIKQALQRNRLIYWGVILFLLFTNDLLAFNGLAQWGNFFRLAAAALMGMLCLRHNIPDLRDVVRSIVTYVVASLTMMLIYIAGFNAAQIVFQSAPGYNPMFAGAIVALILSLIFTPLLTFVRARTTRWFIAEKYDTTRTLREYSVSISNILDLEKLAHTVLRLSTETFRIKKGFLMLVDKEFAASGQIVYRLSSLPSLKDSSPANMTLSGSSPLAHYFADEHRPLLQYDIDFLPAFQSADLNERRWFSQTEAEVYAPIQSKGEWIGLLALGSKMSGRRYTDDDLMLLTTLATQSGVALENARLVENLKKLNSQIREAYSELDKANRNLGKLEMTKSNFISIASHELRTPLTVMRGYSEMLLENPAIPEDVRLMLKGIHSSALRMHEIMDSMFDIAQLDARTMDLQKQDVFIPDLVHSVCIGLAGSAAERKQEIALDLPQMSSIKADPNTLKKVFYHLILNAIKFTPNGGKITITGKQLSANNRDLPEGGIEVVISDTGVGIDKSVQEVIFTKFYQPEELLNKHSTGKTKFKGSGAGLGLALTRGIIEAHGGRIFVESPGYDEEKCFGSTFHVILPMRSQSESKTIRMGSAMKVKL